MFLRALVNTNLLTIYTIMPATNIVDMRRAGYRKPKEKFEDQCLSSTFKKKMKHYVMIMKLVIIDD